MRSAHFAPKFRDCEQLDRIFTQNLRILGQARVNVLQLTLAMDALTP